MTQEMSNIPNPGSPEAVDAGCSCAVIDNHHGKGVPQADGSRQWWRNTGCPLHGIDRINRIDRIDRIASQ